jgi:hypothetical protein
VHFPVSRGKRRDLASRAADIVDVDVDVDVNGFFTDQPAAGGPPGTVRDTNVPAANAPSA